MNVILNHMDTYTSLMKSYYYRCDSDMHFSNSCLELFSESKGITLKTSSSLFLTGCGASESITQLLLPYDKWTDNEVLNWQRAPLNQATLEKRRHQLWCAATSASSTASLPASELGVGLIVFFLGALERLLSHKHPSNVTGTSGLQFPPRWAHLKSVSVKSVN